MYLLISIHIRKVNRHPLHQQKDFRYVAAGASWLQLWSSMQQVAPVHLLAFSTLHPVIELKYFTSPCGLVHSLPLILIPNFTFLRLREALSNKFILSDRNSILN